MSLFPNEDILTKEIESWKGFADSLPDVGAKTTFTKIELAFNEKPVAIISASIGMLGGARAQYHLHQMFVFLNMHPVNGPEVIVTFAQNKFDANGKLTEENTRNLLKQLLQNLIIWTRRLRGQ